jgi:hypothetical protein
VPCGPLPQALDGLGPCPFLSFLRAARIVHRRCRCCLRCRCPCQRPAPGRRQEAHPQEDRLRPHARQELRPRGKQSVMLGVAHGAVVRFRMGEKKGEDLPSTATGLGRRPRVSTLSSPFSFVSLLRTFQITIFDHRGCARKGVEYKGELSGGTDDEMCVKVAQTQLKIDSPAAKELATSVLAVSRNLNPFCASGDSAGYPSWFGPGQLCQLPRTTKPTGTTSARGQVDVCWVASAGVASAGRELAGGIHGRAVQGLEVQKRLVRSRARDDQRDRDMLGEEGATTMREQSAWPVVARRCPFSVQA